MMTLNSEQIIGHNISVRINFRLDEKDLSGNTSATLVAELGIKPQTLSVSFNIKNNQPQALKNIIGLARSLNNDGTRVIYNIVNKTANAGGIKKVRFSGNFTYFNDEQLQQWAVNFTLKEVESVPEKQENQLAIETVNVETAIENIRKVVTQ